CVTLTNPPTSESYTLPLHDALPIYCGPSRLPQPVSSPPRPPPTPPMARWQTRRRITPCSRSVPSPPPVAPPGPTWASISRSHSRSEEHTSELQSRENLVCRLLLEKK